MTKPHKLLLLTLTLITLSGCETGYIIKSGYHEIAMLRRQVPVQQTLDDPAIDAETKRKITLVQEAKKFGEEKLGLVHTKNYSKFVHLDDRYVVYAVTASPKNKLEAYTWSFPIVGRVPYKGFFVKQDAIDEKKSLEEKNLDVNLRGVTAFSTLGWFADPLLSSMTANDELDLVDTIIHETTHATIYIKSNAEFNERLATFVGGEGMKQFYTEKEGADSPKLKEAKNRAEDSKVFSQFLTKHIARLEKFYADHKDSPDLMHDRSLFFENIQMFFEKDCLPLLKTDLYKKFSELNLNNAILLGYKTYYQDLSIFNEAFEKSGRDWHKFFDLMTSLKDSKNPEEDLRQRLK